MQRAACLCYWVQAASSQIQIPGNCINNSSLHCSNCGECTATCFSALNRLQLCNSALHKSYPVSSMPKSKSYQESSIQATARAQRFHNTSLHCCTAKIALHHTDPQKLLFILKQLCFTGLAHHAFRSTEEPTMNSVAPYCTCHLGEGAKKTSQELRMLSSVTLDCQVTKIVMNSGSQL